MADYTLDIVKSLKRKTNGGYTESPVYLGAEQRFVSALRNSNNNNLEEQFLLGTDCLTSQWTSEDGNIHIVKEFYVQPNDYEEKDDDNLESYRISSIIYGEALGAQSFFFYDKDFVSNVEDTNFNKEDLAFEDNNFGAYSYGDNFNLSVAFKGTPSVENFLFYKDIFISNVDDIDFNEEEGKVAFSKNKYGFYSYGDDSNISIVSKGYLVIREDTLQWVNASGEIIDVLTKTVSYRYDEIGKKITKEKITNHLI